MLPLLLIVVLAIAHVGVVVVTKLSVTHTAREVARAVVVDPSVDPQSIAEQARPFGSGPLEVRVRHLDSGVSGRSLIEVRVADRVEGLGSSFVSEPTVSATVAMLAE